MAENKNRNGGKHADEERERDRASETDHEGQARGIRNPFRNERGSASETGRQGSGH